MSNVDFDNDPHKEKESQEAMLKYFLSNTRSIREIRQLPPELRPSVEITCIDERAVVPSGVDVENTVHINTPGGGMEFLSDEEIREIIMASNGVININSHRFCGWGEYIFNKILIGDEQFSDVGSNEQNGILRIMASIKLSIDDGKDTFWRKYGQELESLGVVDKESFINEAREYVMRKFKGEDDDHSKDEIGVLVQQAFVHGKAIKLATRFDKVHEEMVLKYEGSSKGDENIPPRRNGRLQITTYIDTLEDAPHAHIANHAIVNMTKDRVFTSRFQVEGQNAFFSRVSPEKASLLTGLLFQIMEGDHSDTKDDLHEIHIFFDDKILMEQMETELRLLLEGVDTRRISFYFAGEDVGEYHPPLPETS